MIDRLLDLPDIRDVLGRIQDIKISKGEKKNFNDKQRLQMWLECSLKLLEYFRYTAESYTIISYYLKWVKTS